ncbi:hypothetical protein K469DRAFT_720480 [Zopfia rhizophila CBS 207.26]|uniref:Uncharacterized protein n=1 Tax=Zopfia rhizophila CBS 207.26 TaxID=1314779 RepID=A0A6A6EKA5_9PEZI|nr:hypothetical protein K469DRAFT_720480 [Zopfia rhizophila CBS 207.26]
MSLWLSHLISLFFAFLGLNGGANTYSIPTDLNAWRSKPQWLPTREVPHYEKGKDNSTATGIYPLPQHCWQRAKNAEDIEAFRMKNNLTLVTAMPQDAALMPSWPQALMQYLIVNPPINCAATSETKHNGFILSSEAITPFNVLQVIFSPFVFIGWVVSFGISQANHASGGWVSVLGWAGWYELMHFYGVFAIVPLLFQWVASLAIIAQRWQGVIGAVAYRITNLNGCVPYDGLDYLQMGARSRSFKIFQSVTFPTATFFALTLAGNPESFTGGMACLALAELMYTAYVANAGTPMVVSGNCLLVELNPRKGFLDSSINTRWKAFSSFMGF